LFSYWYFLFSSCCFSLVFLLGHLHLSFLVGFFFLMCWDFQFGVRKGFKECVSLELWFGARKEFREWICVLWALAWSKKEIWRKNVACYKGLTTLVWNKITIQHGGVFGPIKLITKMQQSLGASQMSFLVILIFNFLISMVF
jgi:hypothetical protein